MFLSQELFWEKLELIKRKVFYSCKCMYSFENLKEPFPEQNKFYNFLGNRHIRL